MLPIFEKLFQCESKMPDGNSVAFCSDWIAKGSDADDAHLDDVTIGEGTNAGRCSRCDDIAGQQRHDPRNPANYNFDGEKHDRYMTNLLTVAVHARFNRCRSKIQL